MKQGPEEDTDSVNFYEAFTAEMDKVIIKADASAAAVVGVCMRAASRAQRVMDGEDVSAGPWTVSATNAGTHPDGTWQDRALVLASLLPDDFVIDIRLTPEQSQTLVDLVQTIKAAYDQSEG